MLSRVFIVAAQARDESVTQRKLLFLESEVRAQVADVTLKRVARETVLQVMIEEVKDEDEDDAKSDTNSVAPTPRSVRISQATHLPAAVVATARTSPVDATVIPDPFEAYLRECATNAIPVWAFLGTIVVYRMFILELR